MFSIIGIVTVTGSGVTFYNTAGSGYSYAPINFSKTPRTASSVGSVKSVRQVLEFDSTGSRFGSAQASFYWVVIVTAGSTRSYFRAVEELKQGGLGLHRLSLLAVGVGITLALVGLALAVYLISVR